MTENNGDYIGRESALKILCKDCDYPDDKDLCPYKFTGCYLYYDLFNSPAADVRPVVTYKDCRYCPSGTDGHDLEFPYEELFKCPFECDDNWYSRKPRHDFFCANGEPKMEVEE